MRRESNKIDFAQCYLEKEFPTSQNFRICYFSKYLLFLQCMKLVRTFKITSHSLHFDRKCEKQSKEKNLNI